MLWGAGSSNSCWDERVPEVDYRNYVNSKDKVEVTSAYKPGLLRKILNRPGRQRQSPFRSDLTASQLEQEK